MRPSSGLAGVPEPGVARLGCGSLGLGAPVRGSAGRGTVRAPACLRGSVKGGEPVRGAAIRMSSGVSAIREPPGAAPNDGLGCREPPVAGGNPAGSGANCAFASSVERARAAATCVSTRAERPRVSPGSGTPAVVPGKEPTGALPGSEPPDALRGNGSGVLPEMASPGELVRTLGSPPGIDPPVRCRWCPAERGGTTGVHVPSPRTRCLPGTVTSASVIASGRFARRAPPTVLPVMPVRPLQGVGVTARPGRSTRTEQTGGRCPWRLPARRRPHARTPEHLHAHTATDTRRRSSRASSGPGPAQTPGFSPVPH